MNKKHFEKMKDQNDLLSFLDEEGLTAKEALSILQNEVKKIKQNKKDVLEGLTQMGAHLNASRLTPTASGMSPGRCPI